MRFVLIGIPGGRRVELFEAALARRGVPAAVVVPWIDFLAGSADLRELVRPGDVVRIESPGKDFETERALLLLGGIGSAKDLAFDRGRIWWPRAWYAGFGAALRLIASQLDECPRHVRMNCPDDVAVMFDKRACHRLLEAAGVSVPESIGPVESFDQLVDRMGRAGLRRVFVKLAHGSSASGVVAYQTNGRNHLATTTVEMSRTAGAGVRLYNSRAIRTYRDTGEIAILIDELCRHRVHVERWIPKAAIDGRAFDLRVVVIGGRAAHVVVRTSRSPMTNLHLLNRRGDLDRVKSLVGEEAMDDALRQCERAMAECFPRSLYGGVDVLIRSDRRACAVLEVNAFGDLLPGVEWNGMDAYEAEIAHVLKHLVAPVHALAAQEIA